MSRLSLDSSEKNKKRDFKITEIPDDDYVPESIDEEEEQKLSKVGTMGKNQ